jgi:hypothetical protein
VALGLIQKREQGEMEHEKMKKRRDRIHYTRGYRRR